MRPLCREVCVVEPLCPRWGGTAWLVCNCLWLTWTPRMYHALLSLAPICMRFKVVCTMDTRDILARTSVGIARSSGRLSTGASSGEGVVAIPAPRGRGGSAFNDGVKGSSLVPSRQRSRAMRRTAHLLSAKTVRVMGTLVPPPLQMWHGILPLFWQMAQPASLSLHLVHMHSSVPVPLRQTAYRVRSASDTTTNTSTVRSHGSPARRSCLGTTPETRHVAGRDPTPNEPEEATVVRDDESEKCHLLTPAATRSRAASPIPPTFGRTGCRSAWVASRQTPYVSERRGRG